MIAVTALRILGYILMGAKMGSVMDAKYFREKAELCERLADGLSLKNPGRIELVHLAEDFRKQAMELEAQDAVREEKFKSHKAAN